MTLGPSDLQAFHDLKMSLCDHLILHTPLPNHPFILHTDTSSNGLGMVLAQETPQRERPIYFLSRKLSPTETKYAVIEKEALAMHWAIDQLLLPLGQAFK